MKTATVREIKIELKEKTEIELIELCLTLSKFKKENKELLTYLLYERENEASYIESVKEDINLEFEELRDYTIYWTNKKVRKALRNAKKYIRYSKNSETEVELLLFFCSELKILIDELYSTRVLENILNKQIEFIEKKVLKLHEDLQFDYNNIIKELKD